MSDYPEICSMSDNRVRIERLTNGYVVKVTDPKIVKANNARDFSSKNTKPWRDPEREFVFTDLDKVLGWLKTNLDKALPLEDNDSSFDSSFDAAVVEEKE